MDLKQRFRQSYRCPRALSAFIFFALILPTSSFAQLTTPPSQSTPTTAVGIIPTTLQTLTTPSSTASSDPVPDRPSTAAAGTSGIPNPATKSQDDPTTVNPRVFNYYFLIVALGAVLLCLCILYIGRRKKRKAALMRSNGQTALARDVANFRSRFGMGWHSNSGNGTRWRGEREDGLDERGEAPPPYVAEAGPTSVRSRAVATERQGNMSGEAVELDPLGRSGTGTGRRHDPPGYHEHVDSGLERDLARPNPAVIALEEHHPARRLLVNSGTNSHT